MKDDHQLLVTLLVVGLVLVVMIGGALWLS